MKFILDIDIKPPDVKISYRDKIMVVGSCFTEHIGGRLDELKFNVLQNPNGIVFDPLSVSSSLISYIQNKQYTGDDLVYMKEVWQSWQHHSRFSGLVKEDVLQNINASQQAAHAFLKASNWLIITLGSSFSYQLTHTNEPVANCHRAPSQTFNKKLVAIDDIVSSYGYLLNELQKFNSSLKVIFTISPVRHIRDGVVENNRSKARLIEAVHSLVEIYEQAFYFPAYELVIDVLRDYRFYDIDLVHPNYAATEYVFEKFASAFIDEESQSLMGEVKKIVTAFKHKPLQPSSEAHKKFKEKNIEQVLLLKQKHPYLNLDKEIKFFKEEVK
ncbi:MAG TPA: GSCFA domain-containing protein [Segetibacter sp.]|jgi:hypothetical protein